jgi:hypothetical protein
MPKESQPNNLALYLKAVMMYFVANNNLQKDIKGDEMDYINMLTEEYAYTKGK